MKNTRKMVLLALFVAQALVLSIVESWIPVPVPIPGIKLGLANIITIMVIAFWGFPETLAMVVARVTLASLYTGGFVVFLFSITGGILSAVVMLFAYKWLSKRLSILGVSILGSIAHNVGQLTVAAIVMQDWSVMTYLPVLLISGIIMGCFVGLSSNYLMSALKKTGIFNSK